LGHSDGICHCYVDKDADINMAVDVVNDSKMLY
jgi:glutamate-5-semialdehyde dehydrogenase